MPIPAGPVAEISATTVLVALFEQLHEELRSLILGLDDETLNRLPCAGANSIAAIVTHIVESEAETMLRVAGLDAMRDRESEFQRDEQGRDTLLAQLDAADALLMRLASAITDERLLALTTLPTLPATVERPGFTWIIGNLGHAREHVGHAFLTKQLIRAST